VCCDLNALDPAHDKLGCHLGLEFAHIRLSEQELSVQVGDVDGVLDEGVSGVA